MCFHEAYVLVMKYRKWANKGESNQVMINLEENKIQAKVEDACQESLCKMAFKPRYEWDEAANPLKIWGKNVLSRQNI